MLEPLPMRAITRPILGAIAAALTFEATLTVAEAANTGFDPRIIMFGEAREQIQNTPIEQRPYRPLHVYGNTLRRRQSRSGSQSRSAGQR